MEYSTYPELNNFKDNFQLKGEVWKPVKGFEGIYEVSNLGRVKSKGRKIKSRNQVTSFYVTVKECILSANNDSKGYPQVTLQHNGRKRAARVHRLVAEVFVENLENKPHVNHLNGNPLDSRSENLEWCTASENQLHAVATGLRKIPLGENSPNSRLEPEIVSKIYLDAKNKVASQEKIGEKYGVPQITVSNIKTKKTWRHITDNLD